MALGVPSGLVVPVQLGALPLAPGQSLSKGVMDPVFHAMGTPMLPILG